MSTKKDHTKSLLQEFEVDVLELKGRGFTDVDVHSLVNMIWQGWFVDGKPTMEYLQMAQEALKLRQEEPKQEQFQTGIITSLK